MKITYKEISDAKDFLIDCWGANAISVIQTAKTEQQEISFDEFLKSCYACGGDWGQLLLTGIRALFPETYEAIPDNMGLYAFAALCNVLTLCGVYNEN